MPLHLEHIEDGYLVRWYDRPNTLRYKGAIVIVNRGNGEYEIEGWIRPREAWYGYHHELMMELEDMLKDKVEDLKCLTGTFDDRMLHIQERLWRKTYDLIPVKRIEREYNGKMLKATYVRFRRKR